MLYVAALFHDIAKGRGGDHSQLGMADARRFCREHGIERRGRRTGRVAGPAAPDHEPRRAKTGHERSGSHQALRDAGRDERRLTALYLLTVADIRGTSPKVWNAWKGKLLEDLYRATLRRARRRARPTRIRN